MHGRTALLFLLTLFSCDLKKNPETSLTPAFYHWQTRTALTAEEQQYLDSLGVQRLYFKAFDVDWDGRGQEPVPLASVEGLADLAFGGELVPTVFITNRTLQNLDLNGVETLASRIAGKLEGLVAGLPNSIPELQLDCDWTESTRERYFALLEHLRTAFSERGIILSSTIRLHQVRYFERTGVPPIDRGMLMVYNTGRVTQWAEEQTILDPRAVAPYLTRLEAYPLPLDLALPAFAWTAVYRDGKLVRLIHGLRSKAMAEQPQFTVLGENRFELRESMYFNGDYLYRGDRLRAEAPTLWMLEETAALLQPHFSGRDIHLAFYHLDTTTVNHYPPHALQRVVNILDPD